MESNVEREIVLSVAHSGTRFLMKRLDIPDHCHTHWEWDKIMDTLKGRKPVVAMRDPAEVWKSWCGRRNAEGQHLNKKISYEGGVFFLSYGLLHALDQLMDMDVVCVDKQEDQRIRDWDRIGAWHQKPADILPINLKPIYELPIVRRYYADSSLHTS